MALRRAACHGHTATVRELVRLGADIRGTSKVRAKFVLPCAMRCTRSMELQPSRALRVAATPIPFSSWCGWARTSTRKTMCVRTVPHHAVSCCVVSCRVVSWGVSSFAVACSNFNNGHWR